jgi:hypothetical protein
MLHPFGWISEKSRNAVFWVFFAFAILLMIAQQLSGGPLKTAAAPAGIVSFELAGSISKADAILSSWDGMARTFTGLNLGLDFVFIVAYAGAIGLGCSLLGASLGKRFRAFGIVGVSLAWAQLLAAALDSTENYSLITLLLGSKENGWAVLARVCAIPKFSIVLLGLAYLVIAFMMSIATAGVRRNGGPAEKKRP